MNYTPSDLVYLFLDGEADSVQQALLFGALAGDSDLQSEFSQALHMRAALASERTELAPPADVTRELFAKAGFGSAGESAPPVDGGLFGRFGIPLLAAAAGALITAIIFGSIYGSEIDILKKQIDRAGRTATLLRKSSSAPLPASAGGAPRSTDPREAAPSRAEAHPSTPRSTAALSAARSQTIDRPLRKDSGADRPAHGSDAEPIAQSNVPAAIGRTEMRPAELRVADLPASGTATSSSSFLAQAPGSWTMEDEEENTPRHSYSAQLRGITDLRFYPERMTEDASQPWYSNTSVAGFYHIDDNHAIGVAIGEDRMPMYRENGVTFVRDDRLFWGGASYQFRMSPIEMLGGVQPFIEGTAGGTEMGPIGKGMAGLSFSPEDRVSIGVGIEGTALMYRLRGAWYSTRKSGVSYFMNVHF